MTPMKNNVMDKETFYELVNARIMERDLQKKTANVLDHLSQVASQGGSTLGDVEMISRRLFNLGTDFQRASKKLRYAARIASGQYSSKGLNTLIYEVQSAANELEKYLDLDPEQMPEGYIHDSRLEDAIEQLQKYINRTDLLYWEGNSTGAELDFDLDDCTDSDAVKQYFGVD